MRNHKNGIRPGGINDPVAESIRNEQNAAARPSKSEIERMKNQGKVAHAEYKATIAFLDLFDQGDSQFQVHTAAQYLGFDTLAKKTKPRRNNNWDRFQITHEEPHERPNGDEMHPQDPRNHTPPTQVDEEIRKLKHQKFLVVQNATSQVADIRSDRKILNPFGASKAWVMVIEYTRNGRGESFQQFIGTNATFEKAMDRNQWHQERFEDDGERNDEYRDTIERYQAELNELLLEILQYPTT